MKKAITALDLGITGETPLLRVKEILADKAKSGYICPCCHQTAKIYRRRITSAMSYGLILLVVEDERRRNLRKVGVHASEAIHIENFFKGIQGIHNSIRADIPKLRFWGFLERKNGQREDKNPNTGYYYIQPKAYNFVYNDLHVPKYIDIYNDTPVAVSDTNLINLKKSIKQKFNYHELLSNVPSH